MKPFIHYITQWYPEQHPARRKELAQAVGLQLQSSAVLSVHLKNGSTRPTFQEMVNCSRADDQVVNLLLNTDCFIDEASIALLETIKPEEVWCLSREDNCCACSQDAWAWRGSLEVEANYCQGWLGCDNRFAYDCAKAGRVPINPALSVRVNHLHKSQYRTYTEENRVPLPYLFVQPVKVGEPTEVMVRGDAAAKEQVVHLREYFKELTV